MQKGSKVVSKDILQAINTKMKWLILAVAILAYSNTVTHQFALDDFSVIVKHSHVQKGMDGIGTILTTNYRHGNSGFNDGLYRPLSLVTFALEKEFFNNNTTIGHGINIIFYGLGCFFLFLSFRKLLESFPQFVPFSIVLLFALHPIHTEVVANIKGRDELLAFLGFSLSLYHLQKYLLSKATVSLIWGLLFFVISLLSKESSVTFLLLIPLLLLLNERINLKQIGQVFLFLLPFTIGFVLLRASIISSMDRAVDPGNFGILNNPIAATDKTSMRWGSTFSLQLLFLQKLFLPLNLIHDYSFNQIPLQKLTSLPALTGVFSFLSMVIVSVWGVFKRNLLGIAAAFYLISISVASQVVLPIGVQFAERLLFIPTLAFTITLTLGLFYFFKQKKNVLSISKQKTSLIILAAFALAYASVTIDRNEDWENNYTLYQADISAGKNSARVNYNLGSELQRQAQSNPNPTAKTQFLNQSIQHLSKAIQIYPAYLDAYNNLGLAYKDNKDYSNAVKAFKALIQQDPNYSKAYFNMGSTYYADKQFKNAILSLQEYILLKPNSADANFMIGQAYGNLQQFAEAIPFLEQAVSLNSNFTDAHNFLGMAQAMTGNNTVAEVSFLNALNQSPNRTDILMNLAVFYANQGKDQQKTQILQKVLQLDANHQGAKGMLSQQ